MVSRLAVVVIDAVDPDLVADFWCEVLGWRILEREDEVLAIGPNESTWPRIDIAAVPEPKTVKNRLHLDLRAEGTTTHAELERLESLGARRVDVGQGDDVTWTVLADPEGNEFCLLGSA